MRALVFDVDNTLTPPRRRLEAEMAAALAALRVAFHVAAGSDLALVREQLVEPLHTSGFRGCFDAFVCNGSDRYRFELDATVHVQTLRTFSLRNHLGELGFRSLLQALQAVLDDPAFSLQGSTVEISGEQIIDRGSMVNFAPMGRPSQMTSAAFSNRDAFVAFDERMHYRQRILTHLQRTLQPISATSGLRITLGGQTSFDIVIAGNDKTFPLRTLAAEGFDDLTYFGDALHEGGNDAAVLGFIREQQPAGPLRVRAVQVGGWRDTLAHLGRLGEQS